MKKYLFTLFFLLMSLSNIHSQTKLYLTANGITKSATLVQNQATEEIISILEERPIILSMTEYGGFEKIGTLPQYLTSSDERQTAQPGDIMLYTGNVMCIFIGSNTWAYTKLGSMDNMTTSEIKDFLSGNPVEVKLSLGNDAGINEINASDIHKEKVFDLNGKIVTQRPMESGFYIIEGKKTLIK